MKKDYYEILGVSKGASQDEIKKAFHRLAHKHHPHKGGDSKKFKEINEAYQILSNKDKRAQYDKFGKTFDGAGPGGPGGFDFSNFQGFNGQSGVHFDFGDLGDLEDIMGGIFGGGRRSRKKDLRRGRDIQVDIEVSLEDVLKSEEREIDLEKQVVCSRCNGSGGEPGTKVDQCFTCRGTGQVQQMTRTILGTIARNVVCPECKGEGQKPKNPCNVCKGEGRVVGSDKVKVVIPAGADNNQMIKLKGKGEAGKKGGDPGDLYIRIIVKKHPVFIRRGDDLLLEKNISFSQAALGDQIDVPVLGSKDISLKVPAGTEPGKVLRISRKGIPHFSGFGRGDMYVKLNIKTPSKLTRKQKELFEKLKEEGV